MPVRDAGRSAVAVTTSPTLVKKMDLVRKFSFSHGLLGEGAKSVDAVGIEFPGGKTLGDAKNIKMRFDATLHEAGGGRQAVTASEVAMRRLINQTPGRGERCALGALPFIVARCSFM